MRCWRCWMVRETSGFYDKTFTDEELLDIGRLAAAGGVSLDEEIAMLRVAMRRVLEAPIDAAKALQLLSRGAGQLATLMRAKRALSGEAADGLAGAFARALDELSTELGIEL
jgi:CO/xanthine dehydrogenase FAD-binding subunit